MNLIDLLKGVLSGDTPGRSGDSLMEMMPPQLGKPDGTVVNPKQFIKDKELGDCPQCIYDDSGKIVDYNYDKSGAPAGNPFAEGFNKLLKQNQGEAGRGTFMGLLSRFLSPTPEAQVPGQVQGQGRVGGGDPNAGTPGMGIDPGLNPVPTKNQKVPAFKRTDADVPLPRGTPTPLPLSDMPPAPAPIDYSMPNALNPQQIEELRSSLFTQAGQMNVNNPNSLMGRLDSPNSKAEINTQNQEALDIDGSVPRNGTPVSSLPNAINDMHLTPQEQSLYQTHLKNLNGPGGVDNPDGSRSSLYAYSFNVGDKTYMLPSVYDGKKLSPDEAFTRAKQQGLDNFPSYASDTEANARYSQMHNYMDKDTGAYFRNKNRK